MKTYSILVLIAVLLCAGSVEAKYSGGTGEPNDPYRIATAEDLNDIGNHQEDWNKHFILVNDINLAEYTGTRFNRIGTSLGNSFRGVFDGNDHKIWNFTWDSNGIGFVGLFGYVGSSGQIKKLSMENVDINVVNGYYVGGLAGFNQGAITNCYSAGSDSGKSDVGGLVGHNEGAITNSCSSCSVSGEDMVGGLVGFSRWLATISDSYSTGNVTGTWGSTGNLVGFNDGTIIKCYSTGNVTGGYDVGGLVGNSRGTITDCYTAGSVLGYGSVGGLVGHNMNPGMITKCYSIGSVMGTHAVGGLVGLNDGGPITNCYSRGNITGTRGVGGLVGYNNVFSITNCYSTGCVSGSSAVGGLVGYADGGTISSSFWDVNTSGWPTSDGGTPKTTAEMKTKSTFTDAGWDFVEIWGIGENQTYPYLRTELAGDSNHDKKVNLEDLAILASHWLEEK